jgi:hypothetical protein
MSDVCVGFANDISFKSDAHMAPASFLVSNGGYFCRAPKVYSRHRRRHEQNGATIAAAFIHDRIGRYRRVLAARMACFAA